ncbi:MAG: rRNA maturation RNase YbeY [Firmicutes bacterium]|nr:rRNA maturation RNase YbeY [Bacillota bacterium]
MYIYFDEDNMPDEWTAQTMERAAELALDEEGIESECELSVSFVSLEEIHRLNKAYREVDRPTDVLSFPMYERGGIPSEDDLGEGETVELGDVVICTDKAREQAMEYGHSYERELIYLFVHSVFHLLGYDHEEEGEKKEMRAKEESVMDKLGISRN